MFRAAITLFVFALVAGVLGFGNLAGAAAGMARIAFFVFLIMAVAGFVMDRSS